MTTNNTAASLEIKEYRNSGLVEYRINHVVVTEEIFAQELENQGGLDNFHIHDYTCPEFSSFTYITLEAYLEAENEKWDRYYDSLAVDALNGVD